MTAEEIVSQQLWAAWISAGAACVQAIGAVGAIAISINLARDSAHREIEAQKHSREREAAAERPAVTREQAVDQAASRRTQDLLKSERNALIVPVMAAADRARNSLVQKGMVPVKEKHKPNISGYLINLQTTLLMIAI